MDTYICIACRLSSNRLPQKALMNLDNIPLIEVLIKRLSLNFDPKKIILCTVKEDGSSHLKSISNKYGIHYFEGDKLDVMKRFLDAISIHENCTNIVRVTGDNPMTDIRLMKEMINHHVKSNMDYTFTSSIPQGLRSEIISVNYLRDLHKRILDPTNTEYMTYYLKKDSKCRRSQYLESKLCDHKLTFTIDHQYQLDFLNKIISQSPLGIYSNTDDLISTVKSLYGEDFVNIPEQKTVDMTGFVLCQ